MSFEKCKCKFLKQEIHREEQICVEAFVKLSDQQKLLSVKIYPEIESQECLEKEIAVSGKVYFDIIFIDENNKINSSQIISPFVSKFKDENVNEKTKLLTDYNVECYKFDEKNGKVLAFISFEIKITNFEELEVITGGDEGICVDDKNTYSIEMTKADCLNFVEEQIISFNEEIEKIVNASSVVSLIDVEKENDKIILNGEIMTELIYEEKGESHKVNSICKTANFKREIEIIGVNEKSEIDFSIQILKSSYKFSFDEENLKDLVIEIPISFCYQVFEEIPLTCANDIFSLKNQIEIERQIVKRKKNSNMIFFSSKIFGNCHIDESEPRIDKIIYFQTESLKITNKSLAGNDLILDGVLCFSLCYLNDEVENLNITKREMPFIVKLTNIELSSEIKFSVSIKLSDLDVALRRGREIEIEGKINGLISSVCEDSDEFIVNVNLGQFIEPKKYGMEIYFAEKGDSVWKIAKTIRVFPDSILAQNPDVSFPLEENTNIINFENLTEGE